MISRVPSRARSAFTLIELLTVMAIIVILAGLILGTAGFANKKAAASRAQGEIKALETAINSYQIDNGAYPENGDTDALDARADSTGTSGGMPNSPKYAASSLFLFQALCGYFDLSSGSAQKAATLQKTYFPFKGNQLAPTGTSSSSATAANGSIIYNNVKYIVDPFGQCYGYSTAGFKESQNNAAAGVTAAQKAGFNPTFDLWSTAGYGPGKGYPSNVTDHSTLWINNWSAQ